MAACCLSSSEGRPERPVISLNVNQRPIQTAHSTRHMPERLWSEQDAQRLTRDLVRLPAPRHRRTRIVGEWGRPGRTPQRPAACCRRSHGTAGRVPHRGGAVLPGGSVRRLPSGVAMSRAGWPGAAAGFPRGCSAVAYRFDPWRGATPLLNSPLVFAGPRGCGPRGSKMTISDRKPDGNILLSGYSSTIL